jgi:hypothetical protein
MSYSPHALWRLNVGARVVSTHARSTRVLAGLHVVVAPKPPHGDDSKVFPRALRWMLDAAFDEVARFF